MYVTASTILRDGEPYVEAALKSILPHCDAAVLVDTGSVDRTVEIIKDMCRTYLGKHKWKLIETEWKGFGPSRELALPYIPDGWMWKFGHDEIWFQDRAEKVKDALYNYWKYHPEVEYLYPTEVTLEGSHVHRQAGLNCRSQFFRIENRKNVYTFGNMITNDDLSRLNRATGEVKFLGPLCGNTETVKQDDRFTAFINDDTVPDCLHFAKCTQERLDWKTRTYREIVPEWAEETMAKPEDHGIWAGPWPRYLSDEFGLPDYIKQDAERFGVDLILKDSTRSIQVVS